MCYKDVMLFVGHVLQTRRTCDVMLFVGHVLQTHYVVCRTCATNNITSSSQCTNLQKHFARVEISNVSGMTRKIRVLPAQSRFFVMHLRNDRRLAPGLRCCVGCGGGCLCKRGCKRGGVGERGEGEREKEKERGRKEGSGATRVCVSICVILGVCVHSNSTLLLLLTRA